MRYRAIALFLAVLACVDVLSAQSASAASAGKSKQAQQADPSEESPQKKSPPTPGDYFEARVERPAGPTRDPQEVARELGNPLPYKITVGDDGSILIYCHATSLNDCDSKLLDKIKSDIAILFDSQPDIIRLEHAKYVPDIVKAAQGLNYTGITVEAAGPDAIKVTRTVSVTPEQYRDFKVALRNLLWKFQPQAPASRVYYLPAADAAKALRGGASADNGDKSGGPAVSVAPVNGDELVFSDTNPDNDAQTAQKKQLLALIDFPRPEVLINSFSFEASASNSSALSAADSKRQRAIGNYNDAFQSGIDRAWRYLQGQIATKRFFDPTFYGYLTQRFVANSAEELPAGKLLWNDDIQRQGSNVCGAKKYCLGYTSLFNPLRPNLTDMLLAVIASADPKAQFKQAIEEMQHFPFAQAAPDPSKAPADWNELSCDQRDAAVWEQSQDSQLFPMYCFQSFISDAFLTEGKPSAGGPLRAALVNFLFQYKVSQQYPQEFSAYELSQAAQELNSELNPLIVAFNRDLAAALQPIRNNMDPKLKPNGWFGWAGHGSNFVDNGLITVRTVSGKETMVDTQTQSFFDVTNAPSITDVINSIKSAESNVPNVLHTNLTANEAAVIIGALNSVQPATSQVGRQFKIDITPHSLSGASSAELDVKLTTCDSAQPTRYSGGKSSADNISRVAKNDVDTKVRLESIKLFEISSFTAVVRQSRHNFPLLPPFVEIPYLNSFISFPVPGAKEYHRSTVVMSAVIVPTAADLASGVVFSLDRVLFPGRDDGSRQLCATGDGIRVDCITKRALSLGDFGSRNISEFNKKIANCFADPAPAKPCSGISFDDVLPGN